MATTGIEETDAAAPPCLISQGVTSTMNPNNATSRQLLAHKRMWRGYIHRRASSNEFTIENRFWNQNIQNQAIFIRAIQRRRGCSDIGNRVSSGDVNSAQTLRQPFRRHGLPSWHSIGADRELGAVIEYLPCCWCSWRCEAEVAKGRSRIAYVGEVVELTGCL